MFPNTSDEFLTKFPTFYAPRILAYAKINRQDILCQTSDIKDGEFKTLSLEKSSLYFYKI